MRRILFSFVLTCSVWLWGFDAAHAGCGPHMRTFVVTSGNQWGGQPQVRGIRCVYLDPRILNGAYIPANVPAMVWYGEGRWPGQDYYRHAGFAFSQWGAGTLTGTLEDFAAPTNMNPPVRQLTAAVNVHGNYGMMQINIQGPELNEVWWESNNVYGYVAAGLNWNCGHNFDEYQVYDANGGMTGRSLRCISRAARQRGLFIWYGEGQWNGTNYKHLGFPSDRGIGMRDLCTLGEGFCNMTDFGRMNFSMVPCPGDSWSGARCVQVQSSITEIWRPIQ